MRHVDNALARPVDTEHRAETTESEEQSGEPERRALDDADRLMADARTIPEAASDERADRHGPLRR